jgi:hypothetical protein
MGAKEPPIAKFLELISKPVSTLLESTGSKDPGLQIRAADQAILKSKELASFALTCLPFGDFHDVSRAGGPQAQLSLRNPGF